MPGHALNRFAGFSVSEGGLYLRDTTIADATTARHGLLPKLPGSTFKVLDGTGVFVAHPEVFIVPVSDETTVITTGTAKVTFRMPFAMTLASVRASLNVASSSGLPTFDVKESGTTIFSTKVTIDASELTSTTAATPAVLSDTALADDAEMTINIDVAGTGAKGAKLYFIGARAS
jgi:hypothetical protein